MHVCMHVYYWRRKYVSRRLMVLFISSMEDQMEEVCFFIKSLSVGFNLYKPQSWHRLVPKPSSIWAAERPLFRLKFTLRGLAVEFPEVPKCLRSKSLIELNGICPYPTRWEVSYTRLFHRQSLWKIGSKSLSLKQCTPVTLPLTRNPPPVEGLPVSVCQGERVGSNGLACEITALYMPFVVPESHFWEKERHVMNWKRVYFRNNVRKCVLANYSLIFLGWVTMLK